MKFKKIFTVFFTVILCSAVFFFISAAYLGFELKKSENADNKILTEPYHYTPTNSGLMFCFKDGSGCLIYLNFENSSVSAIFTDNASVMRIDKYTVDYTIETDYPLIAGIIDRIGGIELENIDGIYRYTGVQTTELLSDKADSSILKTQILYAIFDKISKNGFSKEDFVYIIENGGTDLLVPDCFYWENYISKAAENFEVIS